LIGPTPLGAHKNAGFAALGGKGASCSSSESSKVRLLSTLMEFDPLPLRNRKVQGWLKQASLAFAFGGIRSLLTGNFDKLRTSDIGQKGTPISRLNQASFSCFSR
jgi:hypothetical protein